jgi:hypothetical protein
MTYRGAAVVITDSMTIAHTSASNGCNCAASEQGPRCTAREPVFKNKAVILFNLLLFRIPKSAAQTKLHFVIVSNFTAPAALCQCRVLAALRHRLSRLSWQRQLCLLHLRRRGVYFCVLICILNAPIKCQ